MAWGDYDNDGFPDLFVANGSGNLAETAFLYRNMGNSNRWLKFKLVGTVSNRSAIGAKVRVKATLRGRTMWQMREIAAPTDHGDQRPNFGLSDATNAEIVRIEWPSGIVQELHDVTAEQILTVTEPPKLEPNVTLTNGLVELKIKSWTGFICGIEGSSDLRSWDRITTLTNSTGALRFTDLDRTNSLGRFYRVVIP